MTANTRNLGNKEKKRQELFTYTEEARQACKKN